MTGEDAGYAVGSGPRRTKKRRTLLPGWAVLVLLVGATLVLITTLPGVLRPTAAISLVVHECPAEVEVDHSWQQQQADGCVPAPGLVTSVTGAAGSSPLPEAVIAGDTATMEDVPVGRRVSVQVHGDTPYAQVLVVDPEGVAPTAELRSLNAQGTSWGRIWEPSEQQSFVILVVPADE